MKSYFKLLSFLFIYCYSLPTYSFLEIKSTKLTSADGLSNNSIRHIFQDSKGFIWLSTQNGLNRYDGNSFKIFRAGDDGTLSLADNRVKYVQEDMNGFLWIATSADVFSCYDLKKDQFVDYTGCGEYLDSYAYMKVEDDCIWLWSKFNGCRRIIYVNGKFVSEKFSRHEDGLNSGCVNFITKDYNGITWIGTNKGLYIYEKEGLSCLDVNNYHLAASNENGDFFVSSSGIVRHYSGNTLSTIGSIPNVKHRRDFPGDIMLNNLWIIFTKSGAVALNTETYSLEKVPHELDIPNAEVIVDKNDNYWLYNGTGTLWYVDKETAKVESFNVMPNTKTKFLIKERYHIVTDSRGIKWISTNGNGLFAYSANNSEMQHFTVEEDENVLSSDDIQYLIEDNSGNIWLSNSFSGLSCLNIINEGAERLYLTKEKDRNKRTVKLIAELDNGNICIGNRNGELFEFSSDLKILKSKEKFSSNIYALREDVSGKTWMVSRSNGMYIDSKNITDDINNPTSLSTNQLFTMLKDSKNRMWIGSLGAGLNLAITDKQGDVSFKVFFNDNYGKKRIRSLYQDYNGWIWCGTSDGLLIFNPDELIADSSAYIQYNRKNSELKSDEIRFITKDSNNNIWIAGAGAGLSKCNLDKIDYKNLRFKNFGITDGLVNDMVQAITEDNNKDLWITTEYGVSRLDLTTETFDNHFFSSNINDNIYSEGSIHKLKDGRIIMGSNNGLVIINPDDIHASKKELNLVFTDMHVNGIPVNSYSSGNILNGAISYATDARLEHYQNSIVIKFSSIDFSSTLFPKYSYRLIGYEEDWNMPSSQNFAAYKNLSPGKYTLSVRVCNQSGQWSENESNLNITVLPPFWKTKIAYMFYFIIIILVIYISYRIIYNMNRLKNKVSVEKQLTEYKLVFFTNISHEFRTPLTLIQGALERIYLGNKIPKEMSYSLSVMDKSTKRMLRLINQLLEFRKMQNDKLALSLEETDVIAFLYEIFLTFKDIAESKKMGYRFNPSYASYKMFIDKENIDKVVYNLLSNAFKYTATGGKVVLSITVDESDKKLIIKVSDTGVGIPKDKRDQLFKRFMQSNFSANSVGVGLHLSHELVTVHKGTIRYDENHEGGSIFTVELNTDRNVYKETDFLIQGNILLQEENAHLQNWTEQSDQELLSSEKDINHSDDVMENSIPLNKRKLLIIEDDSDVRNFLVQTLSVYFEVISEPDGKSGLETALNSDVDIIVSDVIMPGYTGYEITSKLKSNFNTSHIPIILLTALGSAEQHLEGIECGADSYITKPFSTRLLVTTVMKQLEQRDKLKEKFSSDLSLSRPIICTTDKDKEFIERLSAIVEEQLENPDFTADDFASMMTMGRTMFYRKVKGVTGYGPKEYLRIVRMKKAAGLLLTSGDTVSEVAFKVGINDPFYFSKCFKQQFGVSPSAYQKQSETSLKE